MKPRTRRIIVIVIVSIILFLASLYLHFNVITARESLRPNPQEETLCRIYGRVFVPDAEGEIYMFLIDSELMKVPNSGLDTITIDAKSNTLEYEFSAIQEGKYGIRCFQDLNGNGTLDKGLRGPKEPWALTWAAEKRFPPRFRDISFHLKGDTLIQLSLEK